MPFLTETDLKRSFGFWKVALPETVNDLFFLAFVTEEIVDFAGARLS